MCLHPTPSPTPSLASTPPPAQPPAQPPARPPGKQSTVAACILKGSRSLEKINHSDRPVFIICQLCKTLFNFGGEKPELLKNQSGDEVSLEEGIIKGQMAAFRDRQPRHGEGLQAGRGTPASQAARQGSGQGQVKLDSSRWRPEAPETQGASSGPQKGRSTGCQDR